MGKRTGNKAYTQEKEKSRSQKKTFKENQGTGIQAPEEEGYVPYSILNKNLVKMIAGLVPFAILATYLKDNKYLLTDPEKEFMADQWDIVLSERLPEAMSKYGSEYTLLGSMAVLIISKSGMFDGQKTLDETLGGKNAG